MTNRAKNDGKGGKKSTAVDQQLPDNYFRKLALQRVRADLERLTERELTDLTFTIGKGSVTPRADDAVMVSHTFAPKKCGRPRAEETDEIIRTEAKRLFDGGPSQRKVSQRFFPELPLRERYDRYRTRVKDNDSKIQAHLNKLKL